MPLNTIEDYRKLATNLKTEPAALRYQLIRQLGRSDLFFLLWFVCGRTDMAHPWLLDRCREVQNDPYGYLDLWARDHYKSTIITFGRSLQEIIDYTLRDELITIGIFSHTRPIAKGFMRQLKREAENNQLLPYLYPEVFWNDPRTEAPKWSEDDGLIFKRKQNPKEATVEAWGLVDGQPTSKHYTHRKYDDVVTRESVTTPDMIHKTNEAWELSLNLGTQGGVESYIGTRYHFNDTYRLILSRGSAKPRIYPATIDGSMEGDPVLKPKEYLDKLRRDQGPYTFSCQMLQNPRADETQGFRREWLRFYDGSDGSGMNLYILCDPAGEKKKDSDYTVFVVIGLAQDDHYYLLDAVRDRLNLAERTRTLFSLHRKWKPVGVGYEKYGKDSDIEAIQAEMNRVNYRFDIIPLGGATKKNDRIRKLIPLFEGNRFYLPRTIHRTIHDGRTVDLIEQFLNEEYDAFPVPVHDDMLDAMARILEQDLAAIAPITYEQKNEDYGYGQGGSGSAWSA